MDQSTGEFDQPAGDVLMRKGHKGPGRIIVARMRRDDPKPDHGGGSPWIKNFGRSEIDPDALKGVNIVARHSGGDPPGLPANGVQVRRLIVIDINHGRGGLNVNGGPLGTEGGQAFAEPTGAIGVNIF